MSVVNDVQDIVMSDQERRDANKFLVTELHNIMDDETKELLLRFKLSVTYWILIVISIVMFFSGIVMISVPMIAAFRGKTEILALVIAAGFGIVDLTGLFLFRPIERIHGMRGT